MKFSVLTFLIILYPYFLEAQNLDLKWVNHVGGSDSDRGLGIDIGPSGNVTTVGYFTGIVDFDPGPGTLEFNASASENGFIQKLTPNGDLIWARQFVGNEKTSAQSVDVDTQGNVYVTGEFHGTSDLDPGPGNYSVSTNGSSDIFILKLDSLGNFLWATSLGANSGDFGFCIRTDDSGNVYTIGTFSGVIDFDPGPDEFNLSGINNVFIQKLDTDGNFIWAKNIGTNSIGDIQWGASLAVYDDFICATGYFSGTIDFDPGINTTYLTSNGEKDAFILKIDTNGDYVWSKQLGGESDDRGWWIDTDLNGNIFVTGQFQDSIDINPGNSEILVDSNGEEDIFTIKLDSSGNYVWGHQIGGSQEDKPHCIVTDIYGDVYTTGSFSSTVDFDPGTSTSYINSNGGSDIFVQKLSSYGTFRWAYGMGASSFGTDIGGSIDVDENGDICITGAFNETVNFQPWNGSLFISSNGIWDCFIQKLNQPDMSVQSDPLTNSVSLYPNPTGGNHIVIDSDYIMLKADIYSTTGEFLYTVNNPGKVKLSNLSSGMYYIKIIFEKGVVTKPFIVQ